MLEIKFYNHNCAEFTYDLAKLATEGGEVFLPDTWVEIKASKSNVILYAKDITYGTKQKIAEYHNPGSDSIQFVKNQLLYQCGKDVEKFNSKQVKQALGILERNSSSNYAHIIWLNESGNKKAVFRIDIDMKKACFILSNDNHKQVIPFNGDEAKEEALIYYYCDCFAKYDWLNEDYQLQ